MAISFLIYFCFVCGFLSLSIFFIWCLVCVCERHSLVRKKDWRSIKISSSERERKHGSLLWISISSMTHECEKESLSIKLPVWLSLFRVMVVPSKNTHSSYWNSTVRTIVDEQCLANNCSSRKRTEDEEEKRNCWGKNQFLLYSCK